MAKRGRPSGYERDVQPRLEEVKEWVRSGATNRDIAKALGIHVSTFCDYLNKYSEFEEAVRSSRQSGISEVKQALFRKAVGFEYEETKTYIRKDENGNDVKYTERTKRQSLPDTGAIAMYLRNYDKDWSDRDNISNEFRKLEFELRKEMAEKDNW